VGWCCCCIPRFCWPAVTSQTSFDHHQRHTYRQ
jgi:hypothetical protein